MADEMQDPRIADARNRMLAMRGQRDQLAGQASQAAAQFQGGLSLPEQLPQGQIDPRMRMMLMAKQQEMQNPSQGGYNPDMEMERNMAMRGAPNMPPRDLTAPDQDMRNRMIQNRQAMSRPAQGMMQPQNFGRQPMAPPIQEQAMTQANGVAGQGGTPAQMPMANQMNRRQMMGRRMGQRMGMQRPQGQSAAGENPNASPVAGRSITPF
jgi:hypothetical protein